MATRSGQYTSSRIVPAGHRAVPAGELPDDLGGAVARAVGDDEDLAGEPGGRDPVGEFLEPPADRRGLVVDGEHDGNGGEVVSPGGPDGNLRPADRATPVAGEEADENWVAEVGEGDERNARPIADLGQGRVQLHGTLWAIARDYRRGEVGGRRAE